MPYFSLDPVFTRPRQIQTLADATTSMFTDMSINPSKFGTNEQLRNTYFLVLRTAKALCLFLGKSRTEIALEELVHRDDALIRVALEEGIDRKHARIYATGCRKIIEYARSCGWSCDAVVRMDTWKPVREALTYTKDAAVQLVRFLIAAGKIPAETTEEDLQSWHTHITEEVPAEDRMLPATADAILVRFRRRMRRSQLEHLFPHLDLKSKKPTSYRKRKKDWAPAIRAEIEKLVATRAPIYLPGRDARKAWRPASIKNAVDSVSAIYGCLEDQLGLGPFDCLAEMFTTTNLCDSIDWLTQRGLLRQGVHRILDSILALANQFPNLDCGKVRKHIKQVPREPNHWMHAEKQAKSLPYDALSVIPGEIQKLIDAGGLSEFEVAWLLHDKALISVLLEFLFRQRTIRECEGPDAAVSNLVLRRLNPRDMHDLIIPDCVQAAYDADHPSHARKFLMFDLPEDKIKVQRAQKEVLTLTTAETLNAYLNVRAFLEEQTEKKHEKWEKRFGTPKTGPLTTLFMNRHARPLSEHSLRALVRRLSRNYAAKAVPPHLWRDVYSTHFRQLLAIGVENDPGKLSKRLAHIDQQTTDKYSHLDKALAAIAMRNQQYRASLQTQRKETSEQLAQLDSQRDRAA